MVGRRQRHTSQESQRDMLFYLQILIFLIINILIDMGILKSILKLCDLTGKQTVYLSKRSLIAIGSYMKWSETESKDYLMWSLKGKALDFSTITTDI